MTRTAPASAGLWTVWLAAVVFVFPIPHTVALRNLLLLIGLLALLPGLRHAAWPQPLPALRPAAWSLAAATAWLLAHCLTVAPAPTLALDNLRGDWLLPLLTAVLAACATARTGSQQALRAVLAALSAQMLWTLGWQIWLWLAAGMSGGWPAGIVPLGERDYQSSLNVFLLALLVAERLAPLSAGPPAAALPSRLGWAALALSLIADIALRARNGTVVSAALLLAAIACLARSTPRFVMILLALATLGGASIALDSRWSGLASSLVVGWQSPSLYWMNWDPASRPPTASGMPLEESAYARAAWAHQAILAISERPLGLGFGRDGFGRAVEMKYGLHGMVSSHSGWLDFALAAGLPGLALLLLTAGLAIRGGWQQFRRHQDGAGLMFSFLVGGYLLRCLLDGHLSGWRLGLFAFLCGVLIAAMKNPVPPQ